MMWFFFACALLGFIFACTRYEMKHLFHLCLKLTKSPRFSLWIFALLYAPGTLLHELAHYFTSIALFVPPHAMHIVPSIHEYDGGYKLALGAVHSTKTDPIRSLLIGTAPLYWGLALLYGVFSLQLLPQETLLANVLGVYGLFVLSSCMFLSKQDLKHSLMLIPIGICAGAYLYVSTLSLADILQQHVVVEVSKNMTAYLGIVALAHAFMCVCIFLLNRARYRN